MQGINFLRIKSFSMQKTIQLLFSCFIITATLFSCKKEENKVTYKGGTNPVLTASTAEVKLEAGEEANTAIKFSWTNPDYLLTTGASSQDVNYLLEIDTAGTNFSSSIKLSVSVAKDLSKQYTVGELNSILGNVMLLQLNPRRTYNMEARLTSTVTGGGAKLTSGVISFTVKPFPPPPKVPLPAAGNLWVTGDAFTSGWSNPLGNPFDVNQKFTKLASGTDYELIVNMNAAGGYKLIQTQGDWGTQYHMVAGGTASGGLFDYGDANFSFPAPAAAGSYKLSFNFQVGTFTVVKQ